MVIKSAVYVGKAVAISQPMYFPWFGLFDQIRFSDVFVHYDDVQLARGFYNRVQVKTPQGTSMITVPLKNKRRGQKITESLVSYEVDWVSQHRATLISSYKKTKYLDDAISIFDKVTQRRHPLLSDLGRDSVMTVAEYLGLVGERVFLTSSDLDIPGSRSQRLLDISESVEAQIYLTGHGALGYLDHDLFEANGIEVRYMKYALAAYPQVFGAFTPYVTALDVIAHLGPSAMSAFASSTLNWREAVERPDELRP